MVAESTLILLGDPSDPDFEFNGRQIIDLTEDTAVSISGEEMSSDALTFSVKCEDATLAAAAYATQITIVRNALVKSTFFLRYVEQTKENIYQIEATSAVGLLSKEYFYGGYYTGQTLQTVVTSIINTNGLDTTMTEHPEIISLLQYDEGVASIPIYGWIKITDKREALYQVLLSQGVRLMKGENGTLLLTGLYNYTPADIADENIFVGGSTEYAEDVSLIEVTEHTFTYNPVYDEPAKLFDNTNSQSAGTKFIAVFNTDSPILTTPTFSGLTVYYWNCNAAIVTGTGTISAGKSRHTESVISRKISENAEGRTVSVRDCTLITTQNSEVFADRLYNYYKNVVMTARADIKKIDERCGARVRLTNSLGQKITGFISKMTERASGIIKAGCEIISGYTPTAPGGGYSHAVLLTGSGSWTVPESVFQQTTPRIKVIMIGGGTGGGSGYAGEKGGQCHYGLTYGEVTGGAGGAHGEGGEGGKIYTVTINNPAASYNYSCGAGGAGGAASSSHSTSNPGSAGGDTSFGSYSSASGARSDIGITSFFNGKVYGKKMDFDTYGATINNFTKGGRGGFAWWQNGGLSWQAPEIALDVYTNYPNYTIYNGGSAGNARTASSEIPDTTDGWVIKGGRGGGAAAGGNGGNGSSALQVATAYMSGRGGKGADATIVPPKASSSWNGASYEDRFWGCGGLPGCGGGGGGQGGTVYEPAFAGSGRTYSYANGGDGGNGGVGGQGGDGCIIIYY